MQPTRSIARAIALTIVLSTATAAFADDKVWSVSRSSGEVWVTTPGAQQASLTREAGLKPGDAIRTGRNGRVLLVRGEESILVSPNSAIGIPAEVKDGLATTIVQQAGSILLEVEKRNVKHFEVETPYLAAVVKGTKFSVTVSATGTSVNVTRGQVQVADFKSGQIAQIMPGQFATSFAQGKVGLSLSGAGSFAPIEQGAPRAPSIERLMVPKNGLSAPRNAANQQVQPVGQIRAAAIAPAPGSVQPGGTAAVRAAQPSLRIASPIGDVRLNFQKVTNGVARSAGVVTPGRTAASRETTIWNGRDGKASSASTSSVAGDGTGIGNNVAASAGSAAGSAASSHAAAVAIAGNAANSNAGGNSSGTAGNGRGNSDSTSSDASGNSGNGTGSGNGNNGNNGSANGNGNGGNGNGRGNGNRYGNGNGGSGNSGSGHGSNGNGNGGVGNGNGNGNAKH